MGDGDGGAQRTGEEHPVFDCIERERAPECMWMPGFPSIPLITRLEVEVSNLNKKLEEERVQAIDSAARPDKADPAAGPVWLLSADAHNEALLAH